MSDNDLILYTTDDGEAQFSLREMGGTVWLTQLEMAELFQGTKQNISLHRKKYSRRGRIVGKGNCQGILDSSKRGRSLTMTDKVVIY